MTAIVQDGSPEEREKCAKVAEDAKTGPRMQYTLMSKDSALGYQLACDDIAFQIRDRGNQ